MAVASEVRSMLFSLLSYSANYITRGGTGTYESDLVGVKTGSDHLAKK